ncbi:MAG TPA: 30S ribosomal protein S9 [Chloroflexota bacterium]|nr:30S ribosomal protein S9 [Chloroflexota bacterium]
MTQHQEYLYGVGKRKSAIARARLVPGTGQVIINGKAPEQYFGSDRFASVLTQPFQATSTSASFNCVVTVRGGGTTGQAEAVRHAISRALLAGDEELRKPLRSQGLLTRDARVKERKKYGLKRARKAPQYTKR